MRAVRGSVSARERFSGVERHARETPAIGFGEFPVDAPPTRFVESDDPRVLFEKPGVGGRGAIRRTSVWGGGIIDFRRMMLNCGRLRPACPRLRLEESAPISRGVKVGGVLRSRLSVDSGLAEMSRLTSSGAPLFGVSGLEERLTLEHGAGDGEQAVADGAEGSAVAASPASKGSVLGAADRVALDGDAGPVVYCVAEARMRGQSANHGDGLAGSSGDGRDAGEASERAVVASLDEVRRFGEQRGEDGSTDSGEGGEDCRVALLAGSIRRFLVDPVVQEQVQVCLSVLDHPPQDLESFEGAAEVFHGARGDAGDDAHGRLAEDVLELSGGDAADPVLFQQGFKRGQAKAPAPLRRGGRVSRAR